MRIMLHFYTKRKSPELHMRTTIYHTVYTCSLASHDIMNYILHLETVGNIQCARIRMLMLGGIMSVLANYSMSTSNPFHT